MHYSNERLQHIEDAEYLMWSDGMYVMIEDLKCDYEVALVENSLRGSSYFMHPISYKDSEDCLGVMAAAGADYWWGVGYQGGVKLTRAQALYIATGDVSI
jgi:hypothetical protein